MSRVDARTTADVVRLVRDRVPLRLPPWAAGNESDPGTTLLGVLAFLADALALDPHGLPAEARADIARILTRLTRRTEEQPRAPGPVRVAYFDGQVLAADDFRAEQDYVRDRLRRLNRAVHGVGVVSGLEVAVDGSAPDNAPAVSVSPGLAIDPRGEDLIVDAPAACAIPDGGDVWYITLRAVERATAFAPAPGSEGGTSPTRIEEGVALAFEEAPDEGAVVLARLRRDAATWRLDP